MEEDYEQDEYDDYDEYEEVEGSEAEEEEGEEEYEEEPAPTKEELEFLKLREKLKEEFRQKLKKQTGSASDRPSQSQNSNRPANDKFGSFFGPSKPVIAARVLVESRSILETQHVVAKAAPSSASHNKKAQTKASASGQQQQNVNVLSKVASKAKVLKEMRDYSFLLSDDTELPGPVKEEQAPQKAPAPNSGNAVRPTAGNVRQVPRKVPGQSSASQPARLVAKGHQKKSASASQHPPSSKVVARKVGSVTTGNGAGRPIEREALSQKVSAQGTGGTRPPAKIVNGSSGIKKPLPAKPNSSNQAQYSEQRRVGQGQERIKAASRLPLPSSRNQLVKPSSARNVPEERPKKRPLRGDDPDDIRRQIRSLFNYNPDKYSHLDRMDDRDMEVGFDSIMKEEERSLRIAREEDAEQLRLIEEEEKRERMRKKQKLSRK